MSTKNPTPKVTPAMPADYVIIGPPNGAGTYHYFLDPYDPSASLQYAQTYCRYRCKLSRVESEEQALSQGLRLVKRIRL